MQPQWQEKSNFLVKRQTRCQHTKQKFWFMDIIVNKKKQIMLVIVSNNILKIELLPKWISKQTTEHFQKSS